MTRQIDIAIPTKDSGSVLRETLGNAQAAVDRADAAVNQLIIVDDESTDETLTIAREHAAEAGWPTHIMSAPTTLPEARELAIDAVETEWFWFLDDDVRVHEDYLTAQFDAVAPRIGAVQGRKAARTEPPTDWVRRRSRRGGTHATLIRHDAVADVTIPGDMTVLEDEWLRRWVDANGYVWSFNPHARFTHDCQDRHPIGWTEGVVAGKYGLKPFHEVALTVPFTLARGKNPLPHAARACGWLAGRLQGADADSLATATEADL